jgi:lysophospholipase L1-like esterase
VYLAEGHPAQEVTSHPGSRTTSYLLVGDHVAAADLPAATPIDHWYFLSGLRVPATATTAVAVLVGDSLTDGRGSTTNQNDRWPDRLSDRLRSRPETSEVAVLRHAAGGTRLLDDGQGPGALDRLVHAALSRAGLHWLLVFKGINDIGTAPAARAAQRRVAEDLIAAYDQIVTRLQPRGVRGYGATLLPFGGNADFDDPQGHRERARQAVNEWVRGSGRFDDVVDFDRFVRDPDHPRRLSPALDEGDHLHLNPAGYRALADAIPLHLFRRGHPTHPDGVSPGEAHRYAARHDPPVL